MGCCQAVNDEGGIVGYLIMSETSQFPEEGYRVAPFFANNAVIAQSLLKTAVECAILNKTELMFLDATPDLNSDSLNLIEKLQADRVIDRVLWEQKESQRELTKKYVVVRGSFHVLSSVFC